MEEINAIRRKWLLGDQLSVNYAPRLQCFSARSNAGHNVPDALHEVTYRVYNHRLLELHAQYVPTRSKQQLHILFSHVYGILVEVSQHQHHHLFALLTSQQKQLL